MLTVCISVERVTKQKPFCELYPDAEGDVHLDKMGNTVTKHQYLSNQLVGFRALGAEITCEG